MKTKYTILTFSGSDAGITGPPWSQIMSAKVSNQKLYYGTVLNIFLKKHIQFMATLLEKLFNTYQLLYLTDLPEDVIGVVVEV